MTEPIRFSLDGAEVEAALGETIWQVADRQGIEIPHLCWLPKPGYRADGNCRACMVEIEGERVLAASCVRQPMPGMKVQTASERHPVRQHLTPRKSALHHSLRCSVVTSIPRQYLQSIQRCGKRQEKVENQGL